MAETAGPAASVAVTVAATQPEHVTANVVASGAAPSAEKTPEASSTPKEQTAAAPPKPAAAPAPNPEPPKTAKADAPNPSTTAGGTFHGKGDDFYNTIFYFSGMGSVIGSALAHGVYVSDQNRRNAVDPDDVGGTGGGRQTEQLVVGARGQAQNLSTDFHKLQSLLESLPVFTGAGGSSAVAAIDRRNELDQPIHGERRRRPAPGQFDWSTETTTVDVRPWQMSHVRQYDVIDGYPVQRP